MVSGTANAVPLGGEFVINTATDGCQCLVALAPLAFGGFIAVYESHAAGFGHQNGNFPGIVGQRFDATGAKIGAEFKISTSTDLDIRKPDISLLNDGSFLVVWDAFDGNSEGIFGQRLDATGTPVGGEFRINTTTANSQGFPSVTGLIDNNSLVVAWSSRFQDGSDFGVYMQRFDLAGTPVGGETLINTTTASFQQDVDLSPLVNGGFVAVWESGVFFGAGPGSDGDRNGIFGQLFADDGTPVGSEFLINTTTAGNQNEPAVTGLEGGGFVVTWESLPGTQGTLESEVFAQIFDQTGTPVGAEFRVNITLVESQWQPAVTPLFDGGFFIVWEDEAADGSGVGIFGQRFDATGTKVDGEFVINTTTQGIQEFPAVTVMANGNVAVAWHGETIDGDSSGIAAQILATGANIFGTTSGEDTVLGSPGPDSIDGLEGDDLIEALGGDDTLNGGDGSDTLNGGDDGDTLLGGGEADTLRGNDGDDSIEGGAGGDFANGGKQHDEINGDGGDDTLDGANGMDTIRGGDGFDLIFGGRSNDVISGGNDDDTLRGNEGKDTIFGDQGNDLVIGGNQDDSLRGSIGDDTLLGQNGFDILIGEDGNDSLDGGNAGDTIDGGAGNDTILGGEGKDSLIGGGSADTINGGEGNDTLIGGAGNDTFVFNSRWGDDQLDDFSDNDAERIDFSSVGAITDFTDLVDNHIRDNGGTAEIFAGQNTILLVGVTVAEIGLGLAYSDQDFSF